MSFLLDHQHIQRCHYSQPEPGRNSNGFRRISRNSSQASALRRACANRTPQQTTVSRIGSEVGTPAQFPEVPAARESSRRVSLLLPAVERSGPSGDGSAEARTAGNGAISNLPDLCSLLDSAELAIKAALTRRARPAGSSGGRSGRANDRPTPQPSPARASIGLPPVSSHHASTALRISASRRACSGLAARLVRSAGSAWRSYRSSAPIRRAG